MSFEFGSTRVTLPSHHRNMFPKKKQPQMPVLPNVRDPLVL